MIPRDMTEQFRWIVKLRFVAALFIFLSFALIRAMDWLEFPFWFFAIAPMVEMFINQPYQWMVKRIKNHGRLFFFNQIIDVVMITWGIHFVGGMNFFVMTLIYPLVFIFTGIVLRPKTAFFLANFSFLAYGTMVVLELKGILEPIPTLPVSIDPLLHLVMTGLLFPFYNLIAFFSSYLSQTLRRREAELHMAKQRFDEVTRYTREWIWEMNSSGRYIYSNATTEQILGLKPDEVVGKYFYDFFPQEDREKLKQNISDLFKTKAPMRNLTCPHLHQKGFAVFLERNAAPIIGTKGQLLGYRGADQDVTLRKSNEEKLSRCFEELEKAKSELKENKELMMERELKMVELKKEIVELRKWLGDVQNP